MTTALTVPENCAECVCEMATTNAVNCLNEEQCWPLINCVDEVCPDNPLDCPTCTDMFPEGVMTATRLAVALQGVCASACVGPAEEDAGVD